MDEEQGNDQRMEEHGASRRMVVWGAIGGTAAVALAAAGWSVSRQDQDVTPTPRTEAGTGPVKVVILYRQPSDPAVFEEYYLRTHLPMILRIPVLQRLEAGQVVAASPRNPKAFYRITSLYFSDRTAMEEALASPEGKAVFADLVHFATGGVTATLVADPEITFGQEGAAIPAT